MQEDPNTFCVNGSFCFPVKRYLKLYFFVILDEEIFLREREGRAELNVIRESSRLTGISVLVNVYVFVFSQR